jgi:aspartyl-tRNA(Asn)/glutamyl-tRNA(Gln) amidotransferase subunit A
MSLAGIPAISIPAGLAQPDGGSGDARARDSATRLPVGFQIAGPAFSESGILDAAYALERAIGFEARSPAVNGGPS